MSEMVINIISGIAYLILAPVIGGLLAGVDRKISARMQRRVGPPIMQPFYDFFKLWDKQPVAVNKAQSFYVTGFLLFVVISGLFFFTHGDILLVVFTLTMASVCFIVAAYSSNSPYSQIGAERELVQTMSYEPMLLLMALGFYLNCGTFSIGEILKSPQMNFIYMPGIFVGLSYILLIKFRKSPFDLSVSHEAHQELIQGALTEISGRSLALIELAHWYENVFLLGFVYLFFAWTAPWSPALGLFMCAFTYFGDILVDNCCSRVKWENMLASTWLVTLVAGFVNIMFLMQIR
ncbi:MAG: NADH-quinone oxidoreductase subunit H [Acidaminococcaceae bacterium]|jgi:formate hydrogenlyase subunit 4|nr:NADH-quinone oxidoreductase subunit H [Acidaminococcaceae bacterium]MBR6816993.1 NADH-quinone oxidoreductase subunit H [Acidaminococcaceae bacterium]MBR6860382.1 NADH-quinone oxidoreductase subunit H [Acidaminococcaceae bacterium]